MLKHEYYEELCAAAAIGQASPEELADLERHALECSACRRDYAEYLDFAAGRFAESEIPAEVSAQEAESFLNSEQFTQRFFERAQREGISISSIAARDRVAQTSPSLSFFPAARLRKTATWATAAAFLLCAGSAFYWARLTGRLDRMPAALRLGETPTRDSYSQRLEEQLSELKTVNAQLRAERQILTERLRDAREKLSKAASDLHLSSQNGQRLSAEQTLLQSQMVELRKKISDSESSVAAAQKQADTLRDQVGELQASLAEEQLRSRDMGEQLAERKTQEDRERQLLTASHDVNDLMAARNLHIVDVVDTDAHGKRSPSFGRIFYTEGKSLVFYAYDLNESKIEKANYQYRIWSKKEGQDAKVQSLGIFYSDDKSQRRWVFKCNDPKVLNEIDSVFVTLEPSKANPAHPNGANLMYAYLRGQPNHP